MANRLADATSPYLLQHADNPVDWWPWSRGGVRRGEAPRRAGAHLGRLRGLPLVSRDGPRVVRGPRRRRADQRRLRRDQGGPRGAARRRRRLHDRHPGDDRAGRLADDRLRHARRRAVLLRHLLPEGATSSGCSSRSRRPGATSATTCSSRAPRWSRRSAARSSSAGRPRRSRRSCSTPRPPSSARSTTTRTAVSAARPKFPPHMDLLFLLRHHQRTGSARGAGDRPAHRRADGPRRHLRPARRRLRPVLGGRALDRAALREDALRQRAAAAGLHPAVAADRRPARPPDRRRDRRVPAARPRHRRRAGSPPRWTPTPTGVEGLDLRLDAGAARSRCSARTTARWAADLFGVTDERHVRARQQRAAAGPGHRRADPSWSRAGGTCGPGCSTPATPARSRPATTRWWPPGTAWRSPRWPSTALLTGSTPTSTAAAAIALGRGAAPAVHLVDGRLRRVSRDGVVGEPAGVLEDYGCVAEAFCAVHQLTGDGRWLDAGRRAARRRAGPLRRPGRRLLRHRRRRRAAGHPAGRPDRQRHAVRACRRSARRWSAYAALTGETPLPGGGRRGAGHGRAADRRASAVRRLLGGGGRGGAVRAVRDRRRHRRPGRRPAGRRRPAGTPRPAR